MLKIIINKFVTFFGCIEKERYDRLVFMYESLRKIAKLKLETEAELEELNFLLFDLFHDEKNISKLPPEYIASLFTSARMFTSYGNVSKSKNPLECKKKLLNLISFLQNDTWVKVYGKTYHEFK